MNTLDTGDDNIVCVVITTFSFQVGAERRKMQSEFCFETEAGALMYHLEVSCLISVHLLH